MATQQVLTAVGSMTYFELKALLNSKGKELRYVRRRSSAPAHRCMHVGASHYKAIAELEV